MRLLLAEDEKELSDALTAILRHNNYSVDAVYNGIDALDFLTAQDYDGAILDIMMPKMDGITVLTKIRAQGNMTPVLILTAKNQKLMTVCWGLTAALTITCASLFPQKNFWRV